MYITLPSQESSDLYGTTLQGSDLGVLALGGIHPTVGGFLPR